MVGALGAKVWAQQCPSRSHGGGRSLPRNYRGKVLRGRVELDLQGEESRGMQTNRSVMAEPLDVVQSIVSSCECGQRCLDMVEARRWFQALGVSFPAFATTFDEKAGRPRKR